jgi:hypothetical protein
VSWLRLLCPSGAGGGATLPTGCAAPRGASLHPWLHSAAPLGRRSRGYPSTRLSSPRTRRLMVPDRLAGTIGVVTVDGGIAWEMNKGCGPRVEARMKNDPSSICAWLSLVNQHGVRRRHESPHLDPRRIRLELSPSRSLTPRPPDALSSPQKLPSRLTLPDSLSSALCPSHSARLSYRFSQPGLSLPTLSLDSL